MDASDMMAGMVQNPTLPRTSMTLDRARAILTGLHFTQESLSVREREILHIAEGLLRLLDSTTGEVLTGAQQQMRTLATTPGVHEATLYADGVEFAGSLSDSDAQAGFVGGDFTIEQVRMAVGALPVRDAR